MNGAWIRTYGDGDRERVIELWRECGLTVPWNDPGRDIDRKLADSPELFFVAEVPETDGLGRVLVGTCMAGYDGHRGWIFYMGVRPDLQGRGLGRALLDHAEAELKARGCPKVELMVRESNVAVLDFYRNQGYADEPVVVLGKRLVSDE